MGSRNIWLDKDAEFLVNKYDINCSAFMCEELKNKYSDTKLVNKRILHLELQLKFLKSSAEEIGKDDVKLNTIFKEHKLKLEEMNIIIIQHPRKKAAVLRRFNSETKLHITLPFFDKLMEKI